MSSRWYGSLQNRLEEQVSQPTPEVGMLVTELCWSDRHPYEVISIKDSRHVYVRQLGHKVISGSVQDGSAEYEYFSKPTNSEIMIFKKKNGQWVQKFGRKSGCNVFVFGYAEYYYDPCF